MKLWRCGFLVPDAAGDPAMRSCGILPTRQTGREPTQLCICGHVATCISQFGEAQPLPAAGGNDGAQNLQEKVNGESSSA